MDIDEIAYINFDNSVLYVHRAFVNYCGEIYKICYLKEYTILVLPWLPCQYIYDEGTP